MKQKNASKKENTEGRKKENNKTEKQRNREWKGGGEEIGEKQRETLSNKHRCLSLGENRFLL